MSQNGESLPNNTVESISVIRPINEVFKHLFHTKEWSDLTITLESKSFSVHRNIICPAMPYFDTMMSSEFKESRQDHVTLSHPIDIEAFECLIKWAYSFKININSTNIYSLLVASDYLDVNQVFEACCEYLDSILNIETALEIKGIIKDLEVGKLASKVTALIIGNLTVISKSKEWFELPIEVLTKYLEDGDVVGFFEIEKGEAILRWAEYKPDLRQEYLVSLLKLVKWNFVNPTIMIKKIASHEMIKCNESCRKFFIEVFEFMTSHRKSLRIYNYNGEVLMAFLQIQDKLHCLFQLPYSSVWHRWMILNLNLSGKLLVAATDEHIYIYSNNSSTCIHLPSKTYQNTISDHVHSVTASSDEVYITENSSNHQSSHIIKSIKFLFSNYQKCDVSIMGHYLCSYKFVYLNNALYFIGGSRICLCKPGAINIKKSRKVESAELQKYDIAQSKWTRLAPMSTTRLNPHVVALDGKIYVLGGSTYENSDTLISVVKSAEYYDPNLNEWFNLPDPTRGYYFEFLFAYRSKLYAFKDLSLTSWVNIYDPKTGKWSVKDMFVGLGKVLSVISIPNLSKLIKGLLRNKGSII